MAYDVNNLSPIYGDRAGQYSDGDNKGGYHLCITKTLSAGAHADFDLTMEYAFRVTRAQVILKGAGVGSSTIIIKNGTNAITDAMATSGSDTAVVYNTTIDDAYMDISKGGTLRITSVTGASRPACMVLIFGVRI
jgi:hypothetical protein